MFKLFRKWWKYLTAKLTGTFEANADPKVQLEQAIAEAQQQHKRLKDQAANVIASQKTMAPMNGKRSIESTQSSSSISPPTVAAGATRGRSSP